MIWAGRIDRLSSAIAAATAVTLSGLVFAFGGVEDTARVNGLLAMIVVAATAAFGRAAYTNKLPRPFAGSGAIALLALFAFVSALSVTWSLLPGASSVDATRLLAYTAVLATGALVAQVAPGRGRALLCGLLGAALILSFYALVSRMAPQWFTASDVFGRIRLPFEYWNAVGITAVMGLVSALTFGASRELGKWPVAITYPVGGVFAVALMLSQSRGSLLAALVVGAVWLLLVPRRLRSVVWLAAVCGASAIVVAWAFQQDAFTGDYVPLDMRKDTGKTFALLVAALLIALTSAGYLIEQSRRATTLSPDRRYAIGKILLIALALSPLAGLGALATTDRGVGGSISHGVESLVDPDKYGPANSPARLTATSSLRARYWKNTFEIWQDHPFHGTGADTFSAARLPYRNDTLKVRHAHGFLPQVLSDLGLLGLAIVLALGGLWLAATLRLAGARRTAPYRWVTDSDDKIASIGVALVAFAFGFHSNLDWTWFVPGVAIFALLAGGWVLGAAGVGRNRSSIVPKQGDDAKARVLRAAGIALVGLAIASSVYQPARSDRKVKQGYDQLADGSASKALQYGGEAHDLDPTSDAPYFLIATAQVALDKPQAADDTLAAAATDQPANLEAWIRLADHRLAALDDARGALEAIRAALFLSPLDVYANTLVDRARAARTEQVVTQRLDAERRKIRAELRKLEKIRKRLGNGTVPGTGNSR